VHHVTRESSAWPTKRALVSLFTFALTIATTAPLSAQNSPMPRADGATLTTQLQQKQLTTGWRFRAVQSPDHPETTAWHAATVPGVVHTDLEHAGLIPDPFFGDNEKRLQWIGLTDWEYTCDFEVSAASLRQQHAELVFDGLDTFADVQLNGQPILHTDNMFRSWTVDAKPHLVAGHNTLTVLLQSPINTMTPIVAKLPYVLPGTGYEPFDRAKGLYPVGHYMRKAPYHFGWDWGPRFVTSGVWRPVHLDTWSGVRIRALHLQQDSVTAARAITNASVSLDSDIAGAATLELHITDPTGHALPLRQTPVQLDRGANHLLVPLRLDHPQLWWPNGYGPQSRYTIVATIVRNGRHLATATLHTGLRSVELRRAPDQWGTSFTFVINGVPIFAKGANFVPLDSFPPSTTTAKKREILTAAHDVHMNMLRIWGGGFYETDDFYDLCDELGLMVWHDFIFGGAMVPGDKPFQDNVRAEAAEQVERLSDHPSMTIWCGNNEVETAWHNWDGQLEFQKEVSPDQRERVWQDYIVMFRDILKSAVAKHGNGVPYWPSSPGSDFEDAGGTDANGDVHSWKVWSAGAPYTDYAKLSPRFLSEFGFQAMPDLRTVRSFAGNDEDLTSPALLNHERFLNGFDRMQQYLKSEFLPARDLPSFVYLSQLEQAEAIQFGVEHMRSLRPQTMGTLYWQLDDCWPVASWSSIDYYGRWKALHYYARRFYAPIVLAPKFDSANHELRLHVVSDEQTLRTAVLRTRFMRFDGTILSDQRQNISVAPLASTAVTPIALASVSGFDPATTVAVLTLEQAGQPIATHNVYFTRSADLALQQPTLDAQVHPEGSGFVVELGSPTLARAVALSFGDLDAKPSDNYFDLLPNEPRKIHITSGATLPQLQKALAIRSLFDSTTQSATITNGAQPKK
jgi:beta-mannosidase